jgi:hypothetical protein
MSHFTVIVVVPDENREIESADMLKSAVSYRLAPYQEKDGDNLDPKYVEFEDHEDECREQWDTETRDMKKLPTGELVSPYDDFYKRTKPGSQWDTEYVFPPGTTDVEVPMKDVYSSFEEYVEDWHGYEKNEETGRWGLWTNLNSKWDWWLIGGRWTGYFPVKNSEGFSGEPGLMTEANSKEDRKDAVRLCDLDLESQDKETTEAADKFWKNWLYYREHRKDREETFYGTRNTALTLGIIDCKREDEITEDERARAIHWRDFPGFRRNDDMWDVYNDQDLTYEKFINTYRSYFNPICPYSILTAESWESPGEMGWFGCSSDTPESVTTYSDKFMDVLKGLDPNDWLVMVDCHI